MTEETHVHEHALEAMSERIEELEGDLLMARHTTEYFEGRYAKFGDELRKRVMLNMQDDHWRWMGDGSDHLESMGEDMVVTILARDLRKTAPSAEAMFEMIDRLKEVEAENVRLRALSHPDLAGMQRAFEVMARTTRNTTGIGVAASHQPVVDTPGLISVWIDQERVAVFEAKPAPSSEGERDFPNGLPGESTCSIGYHENCSDPSRCGCVCHNAKASSSEGG